MDNDLYSKIFSEGEFHYYWEKHIEYASRCRHVTEEYRRDWVAALEFAKCELGNVFLRTCGKNHPLLNIVQSKGNWQTNEFIGMVKLLANLKSTEGQYEKLKSKLISESICKTEGYPFLEILQMLCSVGFKCRLIEETKIAKSPDIEITNSETGEKFYVEVSKLGDGDNREMIIENYTKFLIALEPPGTYLPYSFAQLRYLNEPEMEKSLAIVTKCREKAMIEETIVYYQDEMIRFTVAHIAKYDELTQWIEKNDYRKGALGAPLNFNDTHRLSNNKMDKEAKQIPLNSAGMVYIPVNALYFMVFDIEEAIRLFTKRMGKYPNLLGTVMYATIIDRAEAISETPDGHFFGIKKPNEAVSRYLFFVRNPHFSLSLSADTTSRIYRSFV